MHTNLHVCIRNQLIQCETMPLIIRQWVKSVLPFDVVSRYKRGICCNATLLLFHPLLFRFTYKFKKISVFTCHK